SAGFKALSHVVLGDYRRTGIRERHVSAGMIAVIVRVDDEPHRFVGDLQLFQSSLNLVRERGELIVDDDDSVFANRSGYVATGAFQHVNVAGDFRGFDLHLREVLSLGPRRWRRRARQPHPQSEKRSSPHAQTAKHVSLPQKMPAHSTTRPASATSAVAQILTKHHSSLHGSRDICRAGPCGSTTKSSEKLAPMPCSGSYRPGSTEKLIPGSSIV